MTTYKEDKNQNTRRKRYLHNEQENNEAALANRIAKRRKRNKQAKASRKINR